MPSRIVGYGKGKAPEKRVCTNCLRKGIECKWDEGGHGKSERFFFFFLTLTQNADRQVLPAVLEAEDPMHARRLRDLVIEEAMYGGGTDSEASEEAEIGASGGNPGSKEA